MDTRVALIGIIVENMEFHAGIKINFCMNTARILSDGWVCHTVSGMRISSALQSMRRRMLSMHFPGKSADLMESRKDGVFECWHGISWRGYELKIYNIGQNQKKYNVGMPNLTSRKTIMIGQG